MKLFINPAELKKLYAASPGWLQKLMNAYADGLNYYLLKHPDVKPRVIRRFEPWMALSFTEGSIGGDIERVNLNQLEAFYGKTTARASVEPDPLHVEPSGSNGSSWRGSFRSRRCAASARGRGCRWRSSSTARSVSPIPANV